MKLTVDEIQQILDIFLDSDLRQLHLEIGDVKLAVTKAGAEGAAQPFSAGLVAAAPVAAVSAPAAAPGAAPVAPAAAPAAGTAPAVGTAPAAAREGLVPITAPSLGVFYRRPAPDQPPFVQEGDGVEAEAPVCLIEVMKMFNRVTAPSRGRIAQILVEDGKMVEYGQTLMLMEPA